MINFFRKEKYIIIISFIFLSLFMIPSLFWGGLYSVGGDDSRLYYIFPKEFLVNFVFKIISDNNLGTIASYSPRSFFAPIIFFIFLLKQVPFINAQLFMYGLNLGFGFLFFYLFLGIFIKNKSYYHFWIKIISGLFYIFSTYLTQTLYINQLLAIYLVSVVPCGLFFSLKVYVKRVSL